MVISNKKQRIFDIFGRINDKIKVKGKKRKKGLTKHSEKNKNIECSLGSYEDRGSSVSFFVFSIPSVGNDVALFHSPPSR